MTKNYFKLPGIYCTYIPRKGCLTFRQDAKLNTRKSVKTIPENEISCKVIGSTIDFFKHLKKAFIAKFLIIKLSEHRV